MKNRLARLPFSILHFTLLILLLAGCSVFRLTQEDAFIDEEGNVLFVRYGELSRSYSYKMVSPANGVEIEGRDKRVVEIKLPEPSSDWITCRICQNNSPKGTMYETKDGKWRYWTIGIMSRLYVINETRDDYLLVFEGDFYPEGSGAKGQTL